MIVFSPVITPRLEYIAGFISKEITGREIILISDVAELEKYDDIRINYSHTPLDHSDYRIQPHPLLFETAITPQHIACFDADGSPAFFKTEGDFPFDIFAASFYLLSRYEEYLPYQKDGYGRYAHENSLAWKEGFLDRPLVNIWLGAFRRSLEATFPSFRGRQSSFTFLPTYDIDMAWSYKYKGFWRNLGGMLRSIGKGRWHSLKERIRVLQGKQRDPFDAFGWMNGLHEKFNLKPYYFFLLAPQRHRYDKNIRPSRDVMKALIRDHVIRYPVGIHPSWQSGDSIPLLKKEMETLASIMGASVRASRQHYIRFTLPETFRILVDNGIQFDFSMGYGSINGFRASVASPFYWYDLPREKPTGLLLFPFCFMEANSFYEQKFTAQQALAELRHYYQVVRAVDGIFIMIWHNSFLGTDPAMADWKEIYRQFIEESAH